LAPGTGMTVPWAKPQFPRQAPKSSQCVAAATAVEAFFVRSDENRLDRDRGAAQTFLCAGPRGARARRLKAVGWRPEDMQSGCHCWLCPAVLLSDPRVYWNSLVGQQPSKVLGGHDGGLLRRAFHCWTSQQWHTLDAKHDLTNLNEVSTTTVQLMLDLQNECSISATPDHGSQPRLATTKHFLRAHRDPGAQVAHFGPRPAGVGCAGEEGSGGIWAHPEINRGISGGSMTNKAIHKRRICGTRRAPLSWSGLHGPLFCARTSPCSGPR
jgi:hypothetical protein